MPYWTSCGRRRRVTFHLVGRENRVDWYGSDSGRQCTVTSVRTEPLRNADGEERLVSSVRDDPATVSTIVIDARRAMRRPDHVGIADTRAKCCVADLQQRARSPTSRRRPVSPTDDGAVLYGRVEQAASVARVFSGMNLMFCPALARSMPSSKRETSRWNSWAISASIGAAADIELEQLAADRGRRRSAVPQIEASMRTSSAVQQRARSRRRGCDTGPSPRIPRCSTSG